MSYEIPPVPEPESIDEFIARKDQEIYALRAIVKALAELQSYEVRDASGYCWFCDSPSNVHDNDCLYARAVKLMEDRRG